MFELSAFADAGPSGTYAWAILAFVAAVALITGHIGRSVQGGQYLSGMPGYRALVAVLYFVPMVILFFTMSPAGWTGSHLYLGGAMAIIAGLVYRAHLGPNHGHQMDMGTVEGTRGEDYRNMVTRFATMMAPAAAINIGIQTLLYASPLWIIITSGALFAVGVFVPASVYLLCHLIDENDTTGEYQATVLAEKTYAAILQAAVICAVGLGMIAQ